MESSRPFYRNADPIDLVENDLMSTHQVKYQITHGEDSVNLKIWELPAQPNKRLRPYSFMANYTVKTTSEAERILCRYFAEDSDLVMEQASTQ